MKKLSKKEWVAIVIALIVVGFMFSFGPGGFFYSGYQAITSGQPVTGEMTPGDFNFNQEIVMNEQTPTDLVINDRVVGTGQEATIGSTVVVHYIGTFADGSTFDSSVSRNQPFEFVLGQGNVIQGWEQGILGMREGGLRQLIVPPQLGYGAADYGPIPGGSTLYFEVQLLEVR